MLDGAGPYPDAGTDAKAVDGADKVFSPNMTTRNPVFAQIEAAFQRAVEVDKAFEDGYYQMGLTYVSMQKTTEAIAVFEQFMKQFPDSAKTPQVKGFLDYLKKK